MIEIAKTKFQLEIESTEKERRQKLLAYEQQCYKGQNNHAANLRILNQMMEEWKQLQGLPGFEGMFAYYKEEIKACEHILAKQAKTQRKAMAKKVSIGLLAIGAIATVGYVVMSMKRNK